MPEMTIADEMMRRKLDPRFDLEKSIEWYNHLAFKWANSPPPSEASADQWQADMRNAAERIQKIYAKHPHLMSHVVHGAKRIQDEASL